MYKRLETENGFYLPSFKSRAISDEYLEGVPKKKFFSIAQASIKTPKIVQKKYNSRAFEIIDFRTE